MTGDKVDFTHIAWGSVQWTMLCTLYLRAYESRSPRPILGDRFAAAAVERIDYDFAKIHKATNPRSNQFTVALRARQFDEWAADFLARHPDATVLHLACGLDSRALRLAPPATVQWFDVDVPEVIALRRQLYEERDGYRMLGTSVTAPGWLEQLPNDRPTLVIAEGLLPYLSEAEARTLLRRVTDRFPAGEVMFDGVAPWVARVVKLFVWGLADPHLIERWNPRLRFLAATSGIQQYRRVPARFHRLLYRLGAAIRPMREFNPMYRYSF
ncbi:class I SAM-dependent methyltransferase [Nannocystis punicea]|uniref:Class I SAM-dependent methyltransferase n=1 Tax=Nannocystis punicea TaxID=2995304 RepID=A0ABY7HBP0_9BACT|nr:class I SAM-dependent methyltransferase [Nannocystis poenicansa]WAS96688.1 class I SAM-dependent methyltransferase [Nannocystis poenicansa]